MSLSPCCRFHPAEVGCRIGQISAPHTAFALRKRARPSDLDLSRPQRVHFITARQLVVSPTEILVDGLQDVNEARLNGMECESMPCKPLAQHAKDPLGIEEFLERHHGIISEADKGTSPLETWPHLTLKPFIQHMVQEDVRETR